MIRFPGIPAALFIVGVLGATTSARADVIRITNGSLVSPVDGFLSQVSVTISSPDHGFSLAAVGDAFGGNYALYRDCFQSPACIPGQLVSLDAGWIGSDFPGTATADGLTFRVAGQSEGTGSVDAEFSGTWTPPAFTGDTTASVTAPFTFTGVVDYPAPPSDPNEPDLFPRRRDTLAGSGVATINLLWGGVNAQFGAWTYAGSRYEFAATPEPATLLLVAPFALGLARWRGVRRGAPPSPRRQSPRDS